jgi:methylmalonyl-CoA/ethylmalonyl-CoA epimerase
MKILRIEHVGIAVESIEKDAPFWKHILGIQHLGTESVKGQGVTTDIYNTEHGKIELLEALGVDSPMVKFLKKLGPGMHHICLEVENIFEAIRELKDNSIETITDEPSVGAEGMLVIFIHPNSTGGVLVELSQKPK